MIRWLSRCIPGLSAIGLITLLLFAFRDSEQPTYFAQEDGNFAVERSLPVQKLKRSQKIFILYSLLLHIDTLYLATRLCFSILVVKRKMRSTFLRRNDLPSGFYSEGILHQTDAQELESRSPKSDARQLRLNEPIMSEVIHAIIIPNYSEDIDTLRLTLSVLAAHPRAKTQYEVSIESCMNIPVKTA
jgi:hypothetical protein